MSKLDDLIDFKTGRQKRVIYSDPDIYEQELEKIFARSWLFVAHECQIKEPGDFIRTFMGEDEVLVVRQKDGGVKAFLNTCTHRGNRLCKADHGNKKTFVCNYHGWGFGTDGALNGVPLEKEAYYNKLDKGKFGLIEVAQIKNYKGLIFATFDKEAPSLEEYLGEMKWYLDSWLDAMPEGTELIGTAMKVELPVNWKLPVENVSGDGYHLGWAHAGAMTVTSSLAVGGLEVGNTGTDNDGAVSVAGLNGHTVLAALDGQSGYGFYPDPTIPLQYLKDNRETVIGRLGKYRGEHLWGSQINLTIFPNLQMLPGLNWFRIYHPKGPGKFEMWTWAMVDKEMSEELKQMILDNVSRTFGPAGLFDNDDGDNLQAITEQSRGWQTRQMDVYTNMAIGGEHSRDEMPGVVSDGLVCEQNQRYVYRRWLEMMNADSWADIPNYNSLEEARATEAK
ncbi:MAG TPA: aromatic ring-hydroxylating dioxygenase subunit alpha [Cycloclasticus sp.]|jgi:3-phenylpropionate/trans-cinnamate dioxygenase alpha subunit|nr:aromatic ring-hydroxylating dioxygenase subunit alpha [Cycloclasticus sp.]